MKKVTYDKVEWWVRSMSDSEIAETIYDLANDEYCQKQMSVDINRNFTEEGETE